MKNYKQIICILGFVLALNVGVVAADAPPLSFTFTRANVPGAIQTSPNAINNAGAVVGEYQDKNSVWHGYIRRGKTLITLDHPNGTETYCVGLPPNGAIAVVGAYTNSTGSVVGFLYKNGKFTDVPGPKGAVASTAWAINDSGTIVGWYEDSSGFYHGFLLSGNVYTTVDVPGASDTQVQGINNKGTMVLGWIGSKRHNEASIYDGKTYKTINVPGATETIVEGINSEGDVVYQWINAVGVSHSALRHAGKYFKFDYPKAIDTWGGGINDENTIIGAYANSKQSSLGYKATYK